MDKDQKASEIWQARQMTSTRPNSIVPRPTREADDAVGASQAAKFRRDRRLPPQSRAEGMAALVGFYLDNGFILHATDQVPRCYSEWWEDACEEGYLLRNIYGIWRLSVVTEAGLKFWRQLQDSDMKRS